MMLLLLVMFGVSGGDIDNSFIISCSFEIWTEERCVYRGEEVMKFRFNHKSESLFVHLFIHSFFSLNGIIQSHIASNFIKNRKTYIHHHDISTEHTIILLL